MLARMGGRARGRRVSQRGLPSRRSRGGPGTRLRVPEAREADAAAVTASAGLMAADPSHRQAFAMLNQAVHGAEQDLIPTCVTAVE
jgi:hypothetical protein